MPATDERLMIEPPFGRDVEPYDEVFLTEHHFTEDGYSPSPLPIASAIAERTRRIRIGTFILLLPLYPPVRVAPLCRLSRILAFSIG